MRIAFVSNYLNVHQAPLCHAFIDALGCEDFRFVATTPFNEQRLKSGYEDMNQQPFVIRAYEDADSAKQVVLDADVVIGLPYGKPDLLRMRLDSGNKLTFVYSERLLKRGRWFSFFLPKRVRVWEGFTRYRRRKCFHVLCASAFTSYDLSLFGFPVERCWKWGYFPVVPESYVPHVENGEPASIVWIGRFIQWKRPYAPLQLASRLLRDGRDFRLTMIGDGEMRDEMASYIVEKGLAENVTMTGAIPNKEVHRIMSESDLFLFTSKRDEGWGAVLNEAMGNGCVPVASSIIGSVPYLVQDGVNGMIYADGDNEGLYRCVSSLLDDREMTIRMSAEAHLTMKELWNPRCAAESFIELAEGLRAGNAPDIHVGPCSPAAVLHDSWLEPHNS